MNATRLQKSPLLILLLESDTGCSSPWAGGPQLQAKQPGQSSGLALTMTGTSRSHSLSRGGLDSLTEECPGEDRECLQAQGQVGIPRKFPDQVVYLLETSHSFSVCFTVQWLATGRMKVTVQWPSNKIILLKIPTQSSVGSSLSFIFLVVNSPGRHRTTHLNEGSQSGHMVFLSSPAFSQKVPCEGSNLPLKGVSQSSLWEHRKVSGTEQSVHSIIILC